MTQAAMSPSSKPTACYSRGLLVLRRRLPVKTGWLPVRSEEPRPRARIHPIGPRVVCVRLRCRRNDDVPAAPVHRGEPLRRRRHVFRGELYERLHLVRRGERDVDEAAGLRMRASVDVDPVSYTHLTLPTIYSV